MYAICMHRIEWLLFFNYGNHVQIGLCSAWNQFTQDLKISAFNGYVVFLLCYITHSPSHTRYGLWHLFQEQKLSSSVKINVLIQHMLLWVIGKLICVIVTHKIKFDYLCHMPILVFSILMDYQCTFFRMQSFVSSPWSPDKIYLILKIDKLYLWYHGYFQVWNR